MACEVFKVVENITPPLIQRLLLLKCSQYTLQRDKTSIISKCGPKSFMHDPESGTFCQTNYEKLKMTASSRLIWNRDVPPRNCSVCR